MKRAAEIGQESSFTVGGLQRVQLLSTNHPQSVIETIIAQLGLVLQPKGPAPKPGLHLAG